MENEVLENFIIRINEIQKNINKEYERDFKEILNKK